MKVLVLNPGSSTLKYRLVDVASGGKALLDGTIDHVAGDSIARAAEEVVGRARPHGIDAVGCRVVHGGEHFAEPALVTPEVLATIRSLARLAPLHNPAAAAVLGALPGLLPGVPAVAVFDTAFHRTMPEHAALYALPPEMGRDKGLRRYGFHGTSHRYVAGRLAALTGKARLITCHLGNGASVCAVRDGKSVDTSMGLTPLAGLVMGTRCGDLDPGLVLHLIRAEGMTADAVDRLLNHESGLKGVGGHGDMRELLRAAADGDGRARLALEMFAYRVRGYLGAYAAALEGLDAIAFTGGIGEHAAAVREKVCAHLGWLGVQFDPAANQAAGGGEVCLTRAGSAVSVWVVPTDEERLIALDTARRVGSR